MVANRPGSASSALPAGVRVLENARPRRLAENVNLGTAATSGDWVVFANPDVVPEPDAVAALVAFGETRERCGLAGPRTVWPDGTLAADAPPVPDGARHDRPPDTAAAPPLAARAPARPLPARRGRHEPVEADWLLGASSSCAATMLDEIGGWDEGYRHYVEDIDLSYRAMRAGWERWYVPAAGVTHDWAQVIDRRSCRATRSGTRGHGALRAEAPRDTRAAVSARRPKADEYARKAAGWTDAAYADAYAYLDHRAELVASLGGALEPGDEVLDLACGDGGLGEHLLARGLAYLGVDAEPAMVEAARSRLGDRAAVEVGDLNQYAPAGPSPARRSSARSTTPRIAPRSSRASRASPSGSSSSTSTRASTRVADVVADLRAAGFRRVELRPFFIPQTRRLPALATRRC